MNIEINTIIGIISFCTGFGLFIGTHLSEYVKNKDLERPKEETEGEKT